MNKNRSVQIRIKARAGEDEWSLKFLGMLFKEVLQEIPLAQATSLVAAYREHKAICVTLAESNYGVYAKTAFQCAIGEDSRLEQTKGTA